MSGLQLPLISNQAWSRKQPTESESEGVATSMSTDPSFFNSVPFVNHLSKEEEVYPVTGELKDAPIVKDMKSSVSCACSCTSGVVVGLSDGFVILISPEAETLLGRHDLSVSALSSSGEIVASGSNDMTVKLFNLGSRKVSTIPGHTDSVTCVFVLPGKKYVVSGSKDHTVRVWSVEDGSQLAYLKEHKGPVTCVSFMQDRNIILSGSTDRTVNIWMYNSWSNARLVFTIPLSGEVTCISMTQDYLLSGSSDGTVRVFKWISGGFSGRFIDIATLDFHEGAVTCLAVTTDGKYILSGSDDKTVRLCEWGYWNEREVETLQGHTGSVTGLTVLSDGRHVVSASMDNTLRIWDIDDAREVAIFTGHKKRVTCLALMPDGKHIISGSEDCTIHIRNLIMKIPAFRLAHFQAQKNQATFDLNVYQQYQKDVEIGVVSASDPESRYYFNMLHVCAHKNKSRMLKSYLETGVPIIRGAFGSPLTIALVQKFHYCVDEILQYLINAPNTDLKFLALQEITADFPQLLRSKNVLFLVPFFTDLLSPSTQFLHVAVNASKTWLPHTVFRTMRSIHLPDFNDEEGLEGKPVRFLVSNFRWNFTFGSSEMLELLLALKHCEDRQVLNTPLVKTLVQFRWKLLLPLAHFHDILYCLLLFCLVEYFFDWDTKLVVTIVFSVIFTSLHYGFITNEVKAVKEESHWKSWWFYVQVIGWITSVYWLVFESTGALGGLLFLLSMHVNHATSGIWLLIINNWLYFFVALGVIFNVGKPEILEILGIVLLCLNWVVLLLFSAKRTEALKAILHYAKLFGGLTAIVWTIMNLILLEAGKGSGIEEETIAEELAEEIILTYLHFTVLCMCCFNVLACFSDFKINIFLHLCILPCLLDPDYDYSRLGNLGIVLIGLNALFLVYEVKLILENRTKYWKDVWNYVDGLRSVMMVVWCSMEYFDEELYLSNLVLICMCLLYGLNLLRTNLSHSHLFLYLISLFLLFGMFSNYSIVPLLFIITQALFLLFETVDSVLHWDVYKTDVWNYAHFVTCLTGLLWGSLRYMEEYQLKFFYYLVLGTFFLRSFSLRSAFEISSNTFLILCSLLLLWWIDGYNDTEVLLVIFITLNALFFISELLKASAGDKKYLSLNVFRYLSCTIWGCIIYYISASGDYDIFDNDWFRYYSVAMVCLCFFPTYSFRTFRNARMFGCMISEIQKEVLTLLIILVLSTLPLLLILQALNFRIAESNITDLAAKAYAFLTADLKNIETEDWICFIAAFLLNMFILITIISDAYHVAHTMEYENDILNILQRVIEYESLLFWKRKESASMVMIACVFDSEADNQVKARFDKLQTVLEDKNRTLESLEAKFELKLKENQSFLESKLKENQSVIEERLEASRIATEEKFDQILAALRAQH